MVSKKHNNGITFYNAEYAKNFDIPGKTKPGIVFNNDIDRFLMPFKYYDIRFNCHLYGYIQVTNNEMFILLTENEVEGIEPFRYYISNFGNVYDEKLHRIMKQHKNPDLYNCVNVACSKTKSKQAHLKVHRGVLGAFRPDELTSDLEVNHKEGFDHGYNDLNNLEGTSHKLNIQHAFQSGLVKNRKAESLEIIEIICQYIEKYGKDHTIKEMIDMIGEEKFNTKRPESLFHSIWNKLCHTSISDKYNFPPYIAPEESIRRVLDQEEVELICRYITEGKTNGEIVRLFGFNRIENEKSYDAFFTLVNRIRLKRTYKNISCKYF